MFGFLAIDKPLGLTSHDVVAAVRRGTKIKRVGHAGTLDPLATGVLVVCIGTATRLSEYVMASDKVYQTTIRLGVETNTYDAEGQVVATADTASLTPEVVSAALMRFNGEQDQIPPMYSAIKKGGKKLYELARKGETIEREARRVTMYTRLLSLSLPDVEIEITCSAGTYIRSVAHDLGAVLGVGGHLVALRRTHSGALSDPIAWEALTASFAAGDWARYLLNERQAIPGVPELPLSADEVREVLYGRMIRAMGNISNAYEICRAYAPDGTFIAILERRGEQWQPAKVFAQNNQEQEDDT